MFIGKRVSTGFFSRCDSAIRYRTLRNAPYRVLQDGGVVLATGAFFVIK